MRSKRNHRVLAWCCTLPWALSFACISFQTTPRVVRPPTLGEELISLDQARKEGLLTQAEYDQRRAETIALWKEISETPIEGGVQPSKPAAAKVEP